MPDIAHPDKIQSMMNIMGAAVAVLGLGGGGWGTLLHWKMKQFDKAETERKESKKNIYSEINKLRDRYEKDQHDMIEKYATKHEVEKAVEKLEQKIEKQGDRIIEALRSQGRDV